MHHLTDDELTRLARDPESDRVERKRSAADTDAIRKNMCAFANDLPGRGQGGLLFIGIEDDGSLSNTPITDEILRSLASARDDGNIMPMLSLVIERRRIADGEVAAVFVEPALYPPVRYRGRVWVRVGPTVRQATPDEEQRLSERGPARDLPFDRRPSPSARLSDLDDRLIRERYLPRAVASEVLEENRRPFEMQLRSLRLLGVRAPLPVWGALLAFSHDPLDWLPGAFVQFLRIDGTVLTDPIRDQALITGRIAQVLRDLEHLLRLNTRIATQIAGVELEVRRPEYPEVALQQLVRNAAMHRDYESGAPIRVHWYRDRVEIISPGGLYGKVSEEHFGEGVTDYRNPLVTEIMTHLGFSQRFGVGIPMARRALEKNGNPPPDFAFSPVQVCATIRPAS